MDRNITPSAAAHAAVADSQVKALAALTGLIHEPQTSDVFELANLRQARNAVSPSFTRQPTVRELAALASHFQSYVSATETLPKTVKAFGAVPPRNMQARLDFICSEFADMAAELMPAPVDAA